MTLILQPGWTNPYVGIPQRDHGRDRNGVDCYGLPWMIYREVAGIDLPSYVGDYASTDEQAEIAGLLADARDTGPWLRVEAGQPVQPLDIALYREGRYDSHIAVIVTADLMLHVASSGNSRIERMDGPRFADRLSGIFRHKVLASRGVR